MEGGLCPRLLSSQSSLNCTRYAVAIGEGEAAQKEKGGIPRVRVLMRSSLESDLLGRHPGVTEPDLRDGVVPPACPTCCSLVTATAFATTSPSRTQRRKDWRQRSKQSARQSWASVRLPAHVAHIKQSARLASMLLTRTLLSNQGLCTAQVSCPESQ